MKLLAWMLAIAAAGFLAACATLPSAPELQLSLNGARQVPPNTSTAAGKASFWVHADRTLNGIVETSGMTGTAANLYLGGAGEVGPLVLELTRTSTDGPMAMEGAPISGASWSLPRNARLSDDQYRAYLAGQVYLNVHSERFPQGEIRGQLSP